MPRKLLPVTLPALVLIAWALPGQAQDRREPLLYPKLRVALSELREARAELKGARDDFGGHRDKALVAVDDAIRSLKGILGIRGDAFPRLDRNRDFYRRHRDYPHLRQSLDDLRDARKELREARSDFGGLKERALKDIDAAAEQIRLLLERGRR